MKTPHPNLPPEELNNLRQELDLLEKDILEQLFLVEQKKRFLAVSDIDILLQGYPSDNCVLHIKDYYDRENNELFFDAIELAIGSGDTITDKKLNSISKEILLDNFENIMKESNSIAFFNDKNGRAELFKIILGDEYSLWQSMHLEDCLDEKNNQRKMKI